MKLNFHDKLKFFFNRSQILSFLLVGCLNTLFGYSLFAIFILAGCHYTIAVLLSTCLGVLFNFKTLGSLVFKNSNKQLLLNFIMVYAILYAINIMLIKIIHSTIPNLYIAGAIATIVIAGLSFYLNKQFVFNER